MTIQRRASGETELQFGPTTVSILPDGFGVSDSHGSYQITNPGEYDVAGIGFEVGEGYALVHAESLRILVIEPTHPKLSAESITALEGIQLVVTPAEASGEQQKKFANLLHDLEPRGVVIVGDASEAKLITGQTVEPQAKIKILPADVADEEMRVWAIA